MNGGNNQQGKPKNKISFPSPNFDYNHPERGALKEDDNDNDNDNDSISRVDVTGAASAIDLTKAEDDDEDGDVDMDRAGDQEEKKQNLEDESNAFIKRMKQKLKEADIPPKIIENAERLMSLVFLDLYAR